MAAPVTLRGLTRWFAGNERPAVRELDLEVEQGEVVCLVGPSGCGKSTTLRLVAGLDVPDSGSVHIDGRDMSRVAPQDRDVAMVFQGFALYPHMKARDILGFPLKMRGVSRADRDKRVDSVADMLGITSLLDRRPAELSGGEQQRVAMGRAIVREPKVFLFDEPLSNLDASLRAELRVELGRLLRRLGATALYVTHDQAEAMTLGSRIALLREGRLEQLDTPRRIYEKPNTTFAARFFGVPPMNLLPAECEGGQARAVGFVLPCPASEGKLLLGIRPEHLSVVAPAERAARPAIEARIVALEPHGAETHVELEAEGQRLRARMAGFDVPAIGESVTLEIELSRVSWFDAETGKAL